MNASPSVPPTRRIGRFGRILFAMISLTIGLQGYQATPTVATDAGTAATVTVAPFSRDRSIFDTDGANGGNAADIPLSGTTTAPNGAQIEARVVHGTSGAQVHPWTAITTASGGAWAGVYPAVRRNTAWLRVQVRVQGDAAVAQTANRFGAGLVIVKEDQSNVARGINGADTIRADAVTIGQSDGKFQMVWSNNAGGGPVGPFIVDDTTTAGTNNEPITSSTARMAQSLNALAPGIPVMMGFIVQPGSAVQDLLHDDPSESRDWDVDVTNVEGTGVVDILTADGSEIGLFHMIHGPGLSGAGEGFTTVIYGTNKEGKVFSGVDQDAVFPDYTNSSVSGPINHVFTEAMPGLKTGRTQWLAARKKPVRIDPAFSGVTDRGLGPERLSEETAYLADRMVPYVPVGSGIVQPEKKNTRDDYSIHFSENDPRGMNEAFAIMGAQIAHASQVGTLADALFDQITWETDGSKIRLGSTAGDVTTKAVADNGGSLNAADYFPDAPEAAPGTPGTSEVLGFFDDAGNPLNAFIEAGEVAVYPPGGQTFDATSMVYYLASDGGSHAIPRGEDSKGEHYALNFTDHFPVILASSWSWSFYGGRFVPAPENAEFINAAKTFPVPAFGTPITTPDDKPHPSGSGRPAIRKRR